MERPDLIRMGSAGWSYPDWDGIVYPEKRDRRFDPLAWLAAFLDAVEINASFYRIPTAAASAGWALRTAPFERFVFTAKLWRGFTHDATPERELREAETAFRLAMEPLRDAGKLRAILLQFPYSFHDTAANRERLSGLSDRFGDFGIVVEVRHASWLAGDFLPFLRKRGISFCNLDQPAISANILPSGHVTAPLAYVRLHGRNAAAWFEEGAGRDRRYDYLYSAEELAEWAHRIRRLAADAGDVMVIANNHFGGQAVTNALELRSMIESTTVKAPPGILSAFPRLADRALSWIPESPGRAGSQGAFPFK